MAAAKAEALCLLLAGAQVEPGINTAEIIDMIQDDGTRIQKLEVR